MSEHTLRYYLSPIEAATDYDGSPMLLPRILKDQLIGDGNNIEGYGTIIPTAGAFLGARALVAVFATDHTSFLADGENDAFPDLIYDAPLRNAFSDNQLAAFKNRFSNRGFDMSSLTLDNTMMDALMIVALVLRAQIDAKLVRHKD